MLIASIAKEYQLSCNLNGSKINTKIFVILPLSITITFTLPYDVGPARVFLGEAEKTPWPHDVWFRPCIAGQHLLHT